MPFLPSGETVREAAYGDPYVYSYEHDPPVTTLTGRLLRTFVPASRIQKSTVETEVPWFLPEARRQAQ